MKAPKKRKPGQPKKPASEKSQTAHCSVTAATYARLLRVFGNASAGGRKVLNHATEEQMIAARDKS